MEKISSDFAILDVKRGRERLARHFTDRQPFSKGPRIPVIITGYIDDIHGDDDGTSREFQVTVTYLQVGMGDAP